MSERSEITGRRKDGSEFPAEGSIAKLVSPQGMLFTISLRDISERKKTEEALRESEARHKSIIAALDEGIVVHDASGAILTCNSGAERILGLTADQIVGRTSMDPRWQAIHPDGSPFPGETHPAMVTLHTGKPCTNVTMGVHKPDGSLTWISINTQPLFHPNEILPYAVVASFTDITDRLQAYQLLERRVEERTRELTALLKVSRDVASTLELKPLLAIILERLRDVVDYTNAGIARLEEDQFIMIEFDGSLPRERMLQFRTLASLDTGYRRVMISRKPYIIGDLWEETPWIRSLQELAGEELQQFYRDIRSWMGVPLIARDQLIGILRLDHTQPNFYTEERAHLVMAFADQAAIAIENARLYEQAHSLAALQERQKLARELHDSVSQALYGIGLGVRTAQTLLERDPLKAAEPLEYCLSLAEAGLAEMRALIFELRPESLELEGLVAALAKQTAATRARYSIQIEETYCPEPQVPLPVIEAFFRIAQETLQNVIKHAHASQVALRLEQAAGTLTLEIRDKGEGFVVADSYPGHLGMKSMCERAEHIGGSFQVESTPGQGTTIRVQVIAH
jgi:PAS domain S-box-containing protein